MELEHVHRQIISVVGDWNKGDDAITQRCRSCYNVYIATDSETIVQLTQIN